MARIVEILVAVNAGLGIAAFLTARHFGRKTAKWIKGQDEPRPPGQ